MKTKIAGLLFIAVTILTGFQGFIPQMPGINEHTITLLSAIVMYLVTTLTVWRQYVSNEISNSAITSTIIVAIIATIGGLNDVFNIIHFSETADQWVRFSITFITFILNVISKLIWPTTQTKTLL